MHGDMLIRRFTILIKTKFPKNHSVFDWNRFVLGSGIIFNGSLLGFVIMLTINYIQETHLLES